MLTIQPIIELALCPPICKSLQSLAMGEKIDGYDVMMHLKKQSRLIVNNKRTDSCRVTAITKQAVDCVKLKNPSFVPHMQSVTGVESTLFI